MTSDAVWKKFFSEITKWSNTIFCGNVDIYHIPSPFLLFLLKIFNIIFHIKFSLILDYCESETTIVRHQDFHASYDSPAKLLHPPFLWLASKTYWIFTFTILNPFSRNSPEDTRKKRNGTKKKQVHDWGKHHEVTMWLATGRHMTKGSLASEWNRLQDFVARNPPYSLRPANHGVKGTT